MSTSNLKNSTNTEKVRFERLRLVARRALEELIKKSLSIEQVNTCFPTLVSSEDGVISLESALSQMSGFWHSNSLDEFDLIYKEKDMESKLNELDNIIQQSQDRKDSGAEPSNIDQLSPLEIVDSTIISKSKDVLDNLQMIYDQLCTENLYLYKEFSEMVNDAKDIDNSIQANIEQLKSEADVCNTTGVKFEKLVSL